MLIHLPRLKSFTLPVFSRLYKEEGDTIRALIETVSWITVQVYNLVTVGHKIIRPSFVMEYLV